jgi:glucuronate isomerase
MSLKLEPLVAARLFEMVRRGECSDDDRDAFEAHMLYEMARMSVEDGLVMAVHPGSLRNYDADAFARYGPDRGHDIPIAVEFTASLRPLLNDFGTAPGFHLVLFTLDETTFSRELAPLAGFYPSVFLGSPWWFLDAPDAMLRFRAAVTETTGFSRYAGFVDDTRAFCSIPARHNVARRVEASFLARMVAEHRISMSRAREIIVEVIDRAPRRAFKL